MSKAQKAHPNEKLYSYEEYLSVFAGRPETNEQQEGENASRTPAEQAKILADETIEVVRKALEDK